MMNGVLSPFFDETKTCPPKSAIAPPRHKTRTLSRYTSKEIIKPFPSAQTSSNHILPNVIVGNAKPTVRAGLILCFALPISIRQFYKDKLTPNRSHNTISKKVAPFDRR